MCPNRLVGVERKMVHSCVGLKFGRENADVVVAAFFLVLFLLVFVVQFNESKLISLSVYNTFFCSVIVIPLLFFLGASSDFLVGRVVLLALVILWSSAFIVLLLMVPKLRILARSYLSSGQLKRITGGKT